MTTHKLTTHPRAKRYIALGLVLLVATCIGSVIYWQRHSSNASGTAKSNVSGIIKYGPTNPLGDFCSAVAPHVTVVFYDSNGKKYETATDANGKYSLSLPKGEYMISYQLQSSGLPAYTANNNESQDIANIGKGSFVTDVTVSSQTPVTFNGCFDTGIR